MGGEERGDNKTPPQHNTSQVQQSCIVKNPSALLAIFSINILLVWFCHEFLFSTQIYKSSICSGCKQCRANVGNGTPHHLIGSRRRDRAQYLIFSNLSLTLQRYSFLISYLCRRIPHSPKIFFFDKPFYVRIFRNLYDVREALFAMERLQRDNNSLIWKSERR